MTIAPQHAAAPSRPVAAPRAAPPLLLPLLSLAATADMLLPGGTRLPAPLWALLLFGVAAAAAARGRAGGTARRAVEPAGMALMMVLHVLHGAPPAAAGAAPVHAHAAGGWLEPALAAAVAALALACVLCAASDARVFGLRRGLLPLVSAAAMGVMAAWMLLGAAA
ncbi:MAG: hypothetical protein ACTHMF_03110 [Leifsonia sp.]|uniref:hypothetical protein n=1 Tax=Leifsonia sp. TaxID=1870902 RepID=UPI003F7D17C8